MPAKLSAAPAIRIPHPAQAAPFVKLIQSNLQRLRRFPVNRKGRRPAPIPKSAVPKVTPSHRALIPKLR